MIDDEDLALSDPGPPPEPDDERSTNAPSHLIKQSRAAWYFSAMAGDRVRYDHGRRRWLVWSGHRWQPDEDGSIERFWLGILAERYLSALAAGDRERQALLNEVQTAGATNSALAGGLELAASMEPVATRANAWDPDPYLLCCNNGVVDLRTGELRGGRPEDMISRSTLINFEPEAACPRWQQFLREVFDGDEQLVEWFGLLIGDSLVGESREVLPVLHGRGNNGKSVCIKSLRAAFGEYAVTIPIETLTNSKREAGQATPDLVKLWGARIAFTTEPDKAARLQGGTLKRLVNVDRMTGRPLYGDQVSWDPTHSLFLATNHLPATDDTTDSFWRRIALVPFPVHFAKIGESGPPEDGDLETKLAAEAPGILAWAIRGAIAAAADSQAVRRFPEAVKVRTEAYRAEQDPLSAFVDDQVVFDTKETVTLKDLYAAYLAWCVAADVSDGDRLGSRAFKTAFEDRDQRVSFRKSTGRGHGQFTHGCTVRTTQEPYPKLFPRVGEMQELWNSPSNGANGANAETLADETPPETTPAKSDRIACSDYRAHGLSHVRDGAAWRCLVCNPLGPPATPPPAEDDEWIGGGRP